MKLQYAILLSTIFCSLSLGSSLISHESQYTPIKSLNKAKLGDVHPSKPTKYFDIKIFLDKRVDTKYSYGSGWSFDMRAYSTLSDREKSKLRSQFPSIKSKGFVNVKKRLSHFRQHYFLYSIDSLSRLRVADSRAKMLRFLGEIDTPVEISIALLPMVGSSMYVDKGKYYSIKNKTWVYIDGIKCDVVTRYIRMNKRGDIISDNIISTDRYSSISRCEKEEKW